MILQTLSLFYCMSIIKSVASVRIFGNILPKKELTAPDEFEAQVLSTTCLLKPQKGPCRANIDMYYFDPVVKNCEKFEWGGCQGNGNRFDTRKDCLDTCLSKPGGARRPPKWCSLTFDYGFCFGAIERWYFDHLWKVCKKTLYSGCGGNRNNFYSQYMCENACRFAKHPNEYITMRATEIVDNTTQPETDLIPLKSQINDTIISSVVPLDNGQQTESMKPGLRAGKDETSNKIVTGI